MIGTLLIPPRFTGWDDVGDPIPGGFLDTFAAGTTTPTPTYFDEDLATIHANTNPIVLDAAGRAVVYLVPGTSYKFVLRTAAGVTVWTQDHVTAGPFFNGTDVAGTAGEVLAAGKIVYLSDGSGGKTAGRWYLGDNTNGYSSTLPTIGMVQVTIGSGGVGVIRTAGSVTGLAGLVVGTTYYVGIAGALTSVPPANARVVGVADTTTSLVLAANPASLASNAVIVQRTILDGNQANFPLTPGVSILYLDGAAIFIQGFTAGVDGQRVTVINRTSGAIESVVYNQDPGATAANRVINLAGSANLGSFSWLAAGAGVLEMVYDATAARWRVTAHDSGWITPAYSGPAFSGNAGTWTVDAGDRTTMKFRVNGRTITVAFTLSGTSLAAGSSELRISNTMWGLYTGASVTYNAAALGYQGGAPIPAQILMNATTFLAIKKNDSTNWAADAGNASYFYGEITFDVT